ncbi:MAG: stage III sporulation protein AB [Firmicutes bacterium]|nr:stage III sporulation protein AB [Bacillota bacterium]
MKIFVCMILGSSCAGLGFLKSFSCRERLYRLHQLRELFQLISTCISFDHMELKSILIEAAIRGPDRYRKLCKEIEEQSRIPNGEDFSHLWNLRGKELFSEAHDREVLELWMRLGRQLGRGGVDQQMQLFQHCFRELDRIETDVAEECKIQSKMYRSLGICLGVFLTVLLI